MLAPAIAQAQQVSIAAGNGQVVHEQFLTTVPFTIQAVDAQGGPVAGLAVSWTITAGSGTLILPVNVTDAAGRATCGYLATSIQPALSYSPSTVTATTSLGNVNFIVTTALSRTLQGSFSPLPLAELVTPPVAAAVLQGTGGSTLVGAISVRVVAQGGLQIGQPIPNVGARLVNDDPTVAPLASCAAPAGMVYTDATGVAICDVLLSSTAGFGRIRVVVGEFVQTAPIELTIQAGTACNYTISSAAASVAPAGGPGSFNVTAGTACTWTAVSSASWLTLTGSGSGSGNGAIAYSVASNSGGQRTATVTVGGRVHTVTQLALGAPAPLSITTPASLHNAEPGLSYATSLSVTGGRAPFGWSASGLPSWLRLDPVTGALTGIAPPSGSATFSVTVTDSTTAQASKSFTLQISVTPVGLNFATTTLSNGTPGAAYRETIRTTGACVTVAGSSITISVQTGTLPGGLQLTRITGTTYELAGTPGAAGSFAFTLRAADSCGQSATANFTIIIGTGSSPGPGPGPGPGPTPGAVLAVTPASLSFRVQVGATTAPANQPLSVQSGTTVAAFTASASSADGWLAIASGVSGNTPGSVAVSVANFARLSAGVYLGTITVVSPGSSPVSIAISLTVFQAAPPLRVTPSELTVQGVTSTVRTVSQRNVDISSDTPAMQFAISRSAESTRWLSISAASGQTPATVVITVDSAGLAVGVYTGVLTVTLAGDSSTSQTVRVTLTVSPPPSMGATPTAISYSFRQGQPPPGPQAIALSSTGTDLPYTVAINTANGGNWLFADRAAGTTPQPVIAQVNPLGLGPGEYRGTMTISTADSPSAVVITVVLSIGLPPPVVAAVTNAASFLAGAVAPGELVTIFGSNLGPDTGVGLQTSAPGIIDNFIAQCRVLFDGIPSPLVYVSGRQVTAIVPYGLTASKTQMEVEYRGVKSAKVELGVAGSMPGIFTAGPAGQAAALNQDGSLNSSSNGAAPDTIVVIFMNGGGQTTPPGLDGKITSDVLPKPILPVAVEIDGRASEILYVGPAPGLPSGVWQVNARLPRETAPGRAASVTVRVGDASSQPGVTIFVAPQ